MATTKAKDVYRADFSDGVCQTAPNLGPLHVAIPAYPPPPADHELKVSPDPPQCPYSRPMEEIRAEEYPHMSNGKINSTTLEPP